MSIDPVHVTQDTSNLRDLSQTTITIFVCVYNKRRCYYPLLNDCYSGYHSLPSNWSLFTNEETNIGFCCKKYPKSNTIHCWEVSILRKYRHSFKISISPPLLLNNDLQTHNSIVLAKFAIFAIYWLSCSVKLLVQCHPVSW